MRSWGREGRLPREGRYIYLHIHTHTHTHTSVDGHSGRFHVLAIVDIIAINTGMHMSFQISALVFFFFLDV